MVECVILIPPPPVYLVTGPKIKHSTKTYIPTCFNETITLHKNIQYISVSYNFTTFWSAFQYILVHFGGIRIFFDILRGWGLALPLPPCCRHMQPQSAQRLPGRTTTRTVLVVRKHPLRPNPQPVFWRSAGHTRSCPCYRTCLRLLPAACLLHFTRYWVADNLVAMQMTVTLAFCSH